MINAFRYSDIMLLKHLSIKQCPNIELKENISENIVLIGFFVHIRLYDQIMAG
jgi:hypothetical protein